MYHYKQNGSSSFDVMRIRLRDPRGFHMPAVYSLLYIRPRSTRKNLYFSHICKYLFIRFSNLNFMRNH